MNILVSTGSFKDTFTSIEFCKQLQNILNEKNNVVMAPFCDGGEHTLEVLKFYFDLQVNYIHNINNCYLREVEVPYIILDNQVYLFTSEIIKLSSDEDILKNPLNLSDYGVGQALHYLYQSGYRKINLCLGGTSTICCGAGAAQAMGIRFFDLYDNEIDNIVCGRDLKRISSYKVPAGNKYDDLTISVLADGDIDYRKMPIVSELKISRQFQDDRRKRILGEIERGVQHFVKIIDEKKRGKYTGAAGGLIMGIGLAASVNSYMGSEYFSKLFHIEDKIMTADIVITGEGKLDNSACGKAPFEILYLAKKYKKHTIYIVGSASEEYLQGMQGGIVHNLYLKKCGIDILLNCQFLYSGINKTIPYKEKMLVYKTEMMGILKELIKEINL